MSLCEQLLLGILRETQIKGSDGNMMCYNVYDVRLKDTYPSCGMNWASDLVDVTPYLRRRDVTEALHISPGNRSG